MTTKQTRRQTADRSTKGLRAALYVRISRDRANEVSTQVQQRDGRAYCRMKEWTVVNVYTDRLSASKRNVVRPAYERLLADVEAGLIDAVVIWKLDRLGRNVLDLCGVAEFLHDHDVHLVSMNDSIDTSTPGGKFVFQVLSAVAELEAAQIAMRVKAASDERARTGKPNGGSCFGYEKDLVTINEERKALLLEAAQRVIAGETMSEIARDWNARQIPTMYEGARWWPANLHRMLMNDHVAGKRRHNGTLVDGNWEAIISPELRQQLLERVSDMYSFRTGTRTPSVLSGIAHCGTCGRRLSLQSSVNIRPGRKKIPAARYRCKSTTGGCGALTVLAEPLETDIRNRVVAALDDPALRKALRSGRRVEDIEQLERQVSGLEDDLALLARRYSEERDPKKKLSIEEWFIARDGLQSQLEEKRDALRGVVSTSGPEVPEIPDTADELLAWWDNAEPLVKRALVRAVFRRIDVHRAPRPGPYCMERIEVTFRDAPVTKREREAAASAAARIPRKARPHPAKQTGTPRAGGAAVRNRSKT